MSTRATRFDVHIHLAGVGTGGSGCWTSPAFRRRPTFLGLRLLYRITREQMATTVDQDWAAQISRLVAESEIDFGVVLGFDGVYDGKGKLDRGRSQLIIPPSWVFQVCREHPNLLPCPSINPYREDALDLLEECIADGAVMIKWLPIVQGFDPASDRARRFRQRLAEARIPLLVHAGGGELTFATVDNSVGDVESLIPALEEGVRVVCAHTAAPVLLARSQVPRLRAMLERYPNLWVDNSGLANPSRAVHLPRFAADSLIEERTLYGSDFPVPANAFYYWRRLGWRRVGKLQRVKNQIQRDGAIKRAMGFTGSSFTRATAVLANLERWCGVRR